MWNKITTQFKCMGTHLVQSQNKIMLRNDKVKWIYDYIKHSHNEMDFESLNNESDEFLDIVIEEICEYENWSVHGLITK